MKRIIIGLFGLAAFGLIGCGSDSPAAASDSLHGDGGQGAMPSWLIGEITCADGDRCGSGQVCLTVGVEECLSPPSDAGGCPPGCTFDHGCRRKSTHCVVVPASCYSVCSGQSCEGATCERCIYSAANVGGCHSRYIAYLPY